MRVRAVCASVRCSKASLFVSNGRKGGKPPNFLTKAVIGMTAGGIGAFVGTPAEVALIRMTADGR